MIKVNLLRCVTNKPNEIDRPPWFERFYWLDAFYAGIFFTIGFWVGVIAVLWGMHDV